MADDEEIELPGFATGGRVERTGIALVHEGEYIAPAPGSEAVIAPDGGPVINYHFPVEVRAVGSLPAAERARLAGEIFDRLGQELAGRL